MGQCWPQCSYPTTTSCQSTLMRRPRHRHCAPRRCSRCSPALSPDLLNLSSHTRITPLSNCLETTKTMPSTMTATTHQTTRSVLTYLTGKFPWSPLTSQDVRLNRILRGPCVHCVAGKLTEPPAPSSTTAPATSPGAVISLDVHMLPETAPGGHTHALHTVDEISGRIDITGAASTTTSPVARCSYRHRVGRMHGNAEKINTSLFLPLSAIGTRLQLSLPAAQYY